MRLINNKKIIANLSRLAEIALQLRVRVKHIVVVADNRVHKIREIQLHFKRTDIPFLRLLLQGLPRVVPAFGQHLEDGRIHPVKMPLCAGTGRRIAVRLVQNTHFFFCCNSDGFAGDSLRAEDQKCFLGHRSGDGSGCQIKNFIRLFLPQRVHRRKNSRHCFSDPGRCLYEELFLPQNGAVNIDNQLVLPFPVGEGKFQAVNGFISLFRPAYLEIRPPLIFRNQIHEPVPEFFQRVLLHEFLLGFGFQADIGHADPDFFQIVLRAVDPGIAHGLCQMDRNGLLNPFQIGIDALDLFDHDLFTCRQNSIGPSLHHKGVVFLFFLPAQGNLRLITGSPASLHLAVHAASGRHCLPLGPSTPAVVQISAPENKFHQRPDGCPYDNFFVLHPSFPAWFLLTHCSPSPPFSLFR